MLYHSFARFLRLLRLDSSKEGKVKVLADGEEEKERNE